MIISEKQFFFIKYFIIFIIISNIIYDDHIYLKLNQKDIIEIDNELKIDLSEKDISFIKYQTDLKPIIIIFHSLNILMRQKYLINLILMQ
jgi:hypothetical protein